MKRHTRSTPSPFRDPAKAMAVLAELASDRSDGRHPYAYEVFADACGRLGLSLDEDALWATSTKRWDRRSARRERNAPRRSPYHTITILGWEPPGHDSLEKHWSEEGEALHAKTEYLPCGGFKSDFVLMDKAEDKGTIRIETCDHYAPGHRKSMATHLRWYRYLYPHMIVKLEPGPRPKLP